MAHGSAPYGTSPFGTGSAGIVGPGVNEFIIASVVPLAKDLVKVVFDQDAIVNKAYLDLNNYTILRANGADWPILKILSPRVHQAQNYVLLNVRAQTDAEAYFIQVRKLVSRTGATISLVDRGWQYYTTKVDSIISSMPSVYALEPGWNVRTLLDAVAIEDSIIGGPGVHNHEQLSVTDSTSTVTGPTGPAGAVGPAGPTGPAVNFTLITDIRILQKA